MELGNRLEKVLEKPKYIRCLKCHRTRNYDDRKDCPICKYGKPKHQPHYKENRKD